MTEFFVGDVVKVELPRGYSNRGVLGISLLYTTSPEARFDGATGTVAEINPVGPYSVHQYLIDFRMHDNSRAGLPWQAHWFREEWIALVERVPVGAAAGARHEPAATVGGGGTPGDRLVAPGTQNDIDPHAAQAGGFSTGEDSELAQQDLPASAPPTGRTTQAPEDGGYFGSPAVDQPTREHGGEERGAGVVDPDATGDPAPTSGGDGASAATAELNPRGVETAKLDPATITSADEADVLSGRSTGSVSGASTTAPSGPIGETEMRTTPEETKPLSRSGTSLLDPSRVAGFDEDLGGSTGSVDEGGLARQGDGGRTANQG